MTDSQDSPFDSTIEEPSQKPEGPLNEHLVLRFARHLQELERKHDWVDLSERTLCQNCGDSPENPVAANCFHVFCKECLLYLQRQAAERTQHELACPKCGECLTETQPCEDLKSLRLDNSFQVGRQAGMKMGRNIGKGYIDLEDEDTNQPDPGFTMEQKRFPVRSINMLLELSYSEYCAEHTNYLSPTSEPINLRTLKRNLQDGLYLSIEALRADFGRMQLNCVIGNHICTEHARSLRADFETYMAKFPGRDEDFAPRKKATTREPKAPSAPITERAVASSPQRAAKTAMQGRKYPRDHP